MVCKYCGGELLSRGCVKRLIRGENGSKTQILINRYSCKECGKWCRELPDNVVPFKQYTKDIIDGFVNGDLSNDDIEYEDYPCDMTQKRWRKM